MQAQPSVNTDGTGAAAEDPGAKRRRIDDAAQDAHAPDAALVAELVAASSREAVLEVCRRYGATQLQQLAGSEPVTVTAAAKPGAIEQTRDGSIGVAPKPAPEPVARKQVTFRVLVSALRAEQLTSDLDSGTGATVEVEDAVIGCDDRVIRCTSAEVTGATRISAQDAVTAAAKASFAPATEGDARLKSSSLRLLVPKQQLGSVLGKGGSTINTIRAMTTAVIKVQDDALPSCAHPGTEEMITITGDENAVTLATQRVTGQLRTFQVSGTTNLVSAVGAPPGVATAGGATGPRKQPLLQRQPTAVLPAVAAGTITERLTVDNAHVRLCSTC